MSLDLIVGLLLVAASLVVLRLGQTRPACWCGRKLRHVGAVTGDLCPTHWLETFK